MLIRHCRGQYSDAVLNELESQNDGQVEGIMGKVRQLKDVRLHSPRITTAVLLFNPTNFMISR